MKFGENEAKKILQDFLHIDFVDNYHDDGKHNGLPDFLLANGNYLEVTHTEHDFGWKPKEEFVDCGSVEENEKQLKEKYKRAMKVNEAIHRIHDYDYEMIDGKLSPKAEIQFRQDKNLVRMETGRDYSKKIYGNEDFMGKTSFSITYSVDNISNVITKKDKKHKGKPIELFVFADEREINSMYMCLKYECASTKGFIKMLYNSTFSRIFFCSCNMFGNHEYGSPEKTVKYNFTDPLIVISEKEPDGVVFSAYKGILICNKKVKYEGEYIK